MLMAVIHDYERDEPRCALTLCREVGVGRLDETIAGSVTSGMQMILFTLTRSPRSQNPGMKKKCRPSRNRGTLTMAKIS